VTSAVAGSYLNSIPVGGLITTNAGANTVAASATLTVLGGLTVAKSFTPASIGTNGTSVLTITLTNPNASAVTGADFTDSYPVNLVNTGWERCDQCATARRAGTRRLAPAQRVGTVTVNVTDATAGSYLNSTGGVTTTNAGTRQAPPRR
jgi:hypothetical protein